MSRTYRNHGHDAMYFRHPHTMNERRQLEGLKTDARLHQVNISPTNRLSRHIADEWDDVTISSFAETFFQD